MSFVCSIHCELIAFAQSTAPALQTYLGRTPRQSRALCTRRSVLIVLLDHLRFQKLLEAERLAQPSAHGFQAVMSSLGPRSSSRCPRLVLHLPAQPQERLAGRGDVRSSPRWHTQRCGRCQSSRGSSTARDADYLDCLRDAVCHEMVTREYTL